MLLRSQRLFLSWSCIMYTIRLSHIHSSPIWFPRWHMMFEGYQRIEKKMFIGRKETRLSCYFIGGITWISSSFKLGVFLIKQKAQEIWSKSAKSKLFSLRCFRPPIVCGSSCGRESAAKNFKAKNGNKILKVSMFICTHWRKKISKQEWTEMGNTAMDMFIWTP